MFEAIASAAHSESSRRTKAGWTPSVSSTCPTLESAAFSSSRGRDLAGQFEALASSSERASIAVRPLSERLIGIWRGFAFSATGKRSVRTPSS